MNKQQKVDFLKRLSKGKASLSEVNQHHFDFSLPFVSWEETETRGVYANLKSELLSGIGIGPGELLLTRKQMDEFEKTHNLKCTDILFDRQTRPGELEPINYPGDIVFS